MFQVETNPAENLLKFAFSGSVTTDETARWRAQLDGLLKQLRPGFKLLSDFSGVESIDVACAPDIEFVMELLNKAGIAKVVRVITHPRQDIGMSIMSLFHYRRCVAIVTCQTMEEALRALAD
ncbi:MAG TPA: hypothetical protein VH597_12135 [Verrucomicrobiae bacterium]|jgi:hypothetical protein|nr:hypothetical protein [Verrucomicrobiae bacterium]